MKKIIAITAVLLFLIGCTSAEQSEPTIIFSETVTSTQPVSTKTIEPTRTATIITMTPTATSKPTDPPAATNTDTPTVEPTATSVPLPADEYMQTLGSKGYKLFSSSSFTGLDEQNYAAYVFTNAEQDFYYTGNAPGHDSWQIVFYRLSGTESEFMGTFSAPVYKDYDPESGYPYSYNVVNWDALSELPYGDLVENQSEAQQWMSQNGARSDINQNGLPEFALSAVYCPFSCSWPQMALHFYELGNGTSVQFLTGNLPGRFAQDKHPETGIVHSTEPLNYYVDEHYDYLDSAGIDPWWVYEWDGTEFVDVSTRYADEYRKEVQEIVTTLQRQYGKPYSYSNDLDIFKIPIILEKPGLKEEGVATLLEVTNLENWPGSDPMDLCWLQLVGAFAQEDYKKRDDFSGMLSAVYCMDSLSACVASFDQTVYDLSSCQMLLP